MKLGFTITESKQQPKQWKKSGELTPIKAKAILSAGKVMTSVFWDFKGVIMVDYLARGETINTAYYCILLRKIKEKYPRLFRKNVLFHQDNARLHTSVESMAQIRDNGFELGPYPAYSPDLAPSDFQLFPNLKTSRWTEVFIE
jgi:[histone H3]-lysine36 N-dimethyltransferase SETMAR